MGDRRDERVASRKGVVLGIIAMCGSACTTPSPKHQQPPVDCFAKPTFASPGVIAFRPTPPECTHLRKYLPAQYGITASVDQDEPQLVVLHVTERPRSLAGVEPSELNAFLPMAEKGAPVANAPVAIVKAGTGEPVFQGTTDSEGNVSVATSDLEKVAPDTGLPTNRALLAQCRMIVGGTLECPPNIDIWIDGVRPTNGPLVVQQVEQHVRVMRARAKEEEEWARLDPQRCLDDPTEQNCARVLRFAKNHRSNPNATAFLKAFVNNPNVREKMQEAERTAAAARHARANEPTCRQVQWDVDEYRKQCSDTADGKACNIVAWENACTANDAEACSKLGLMQINCTYVSVQDPPKMIAYMKRTCQLDPSWCFTLGGLVFNPGGTIPWPEDRANLAVWFLRQACDNDFKRGGTCANIGALLADGGDRNVRALLPEGYKLAPEFFRKACKLGNPTGCQRSGGGSQ